MSDRVVILTGANSDIGLAMTRSLLALGNHVGALDIEAGNLLGRRRTGYLGSD